MTQIMLLQICYQVSLFKTLNWLHLDHYKASMINTFLLAMDQITMWNTNDEPPENYDLNW